MVKITVSADCGNAPKKLLLKDLNIAFVKGDTAFISESVADDLMWELVGDQTIHGKDDFVKAVKQKLTKQQR